MKRTSHAGYRNARSPIQRIVNHGGANIAAKSPAIARVKRMMLILNDINKLQYRKIDRKIYMNALV